MTSEIISPEAPVADMVPTTTSCPSFIDLRALFAGVRHNASAEPYLGNRTILSLRGGPVEVGSICLPAGRGKVDQVAGDEFVIVADGAVTFTRDGQTIELTEGQCCVFTDGAGFRWSAREEAKLIYMRYVNGTGAEARLVPVDAQAELAPSGAPLAELLVGPTPQCRNHTDYLSADGEFMAGVWDSTPYHRRAMPYRHFELMYLLQGSVTFVDELGREGTFSKGDIFLIEQHAQCSWESREDVAKVYAIYRPAA